MRGTKNQSSFSERYKSTSFAKSLNPQVSSLWRKDNAVWCTDILPQADANSQLRDVSDSNPLVNGDSSQGTLGYSTGVR